MAGGAKRLGIGAVAVFAGTALGGCGAATADQDGEGDSGRSRVVVDMDGGPAIGVGQPSTYAPAGERARSEDVAGVLGLGRPATADQIRAIDIDVGPDGAGLPPGAGTAAAGAQVYLVKCSYCHGANGEGGPDVRLLGEGGRTVSNYWPYATTLFDYTRRAMPFDNPGSLTDQEVYDVTAWLLFKSGLIAEDTRLDGSALAAVAMPGLDRFTPDVRERYNAVR